MDARQPERQDGEGVLETDRSGGAEDGSMGVVGSEGATAGGFRTLLAGAAGDVVGTGPIGWPPGTARGGAPWPGLAPGGGAWLDGGAWPGPPPVGGAWASAGA